MLLPKVRDGWQTNPTSDERRAAFPFRTAPMTCEERTRGSDLDGVRAWGTPPRPGLSSAASCLGIGLSV